MKNTDNTTREKKYLQFLKDKADKEIRAFFDNSDYGNVIIDTTKLSKFLYSRLCIICENSLDIIFIKRVLSNGLFGKYSENNSCDEVLKLEEEFYKELSEKENEVLKSDNGRLLFAIEESIQLFVEFIDEYLKRFERDQKEIEGTLLNGNKCKQIVTLIPGVGDCHNHGRTTMIVETGAGKFVYKPHDVSIDLWAKHFFESFFPEVSKLPSVVCREGYGYCQFIENRPASTKEDASRYYENLGQFCAIATILGSKDLHLENILSDGIHPIPIDLEMMICPIKHEKVIVNSCLEKSIHMTGFMPLKIDGEIEGSLLFSEAEDNLSAPVINGKKVNVCAFGKEFLKGFEEGYLSFLKQKEEIVRFIEQMPVFQVRYLFRDSNAYMNLIEKSFSYQWLKDSKLDEEVKKALTIGFIKIGDTKPIVIESESKAVLQANVPYFYSYSNSKNLFDLDGLVQENFFIKSCKENLMDLIEGSGLAELSFNNKIIETSIERYSKESYKPINHISDSLKHEEFIEQAELLFERILEEKIEAPDGTLLWFGLDPQGKSLMYMIQDGYVFGLMGIAVFAAALSVCTNKEKLKKETKELAQRIVDQVISNIKVYAKEEKIYENQLSLGFDTGVAGILHANELIDNYIHIPICEELRSTILSLLPRIDTSYTASDIFHGFSGIIKVLCKYKNLYYRKGVSGIVSNYCDALLDKRVPLCNGMMLWDTLNKKRAISGAAHGQVGIASALLLASKILRRQDLLDAAKTAFEWEDITFSEELGSWPDLRETEEPKHAMHGYCSGAPGVGFEMLQYNTDLGKRNVERAIKACLSKDLPNRDNVCCGKPSVVDFLINAGLISDGKKLMYRALSNAEKNGLLFNSDYENLFEVNLFYGASGVGYECLRCANPTLVLPLYI